LRHCRHNIYSARAGIFFKPGIFYPAFFLNPAFFTRHFLPGIFYPAFYRTPRHFFSRDGTAFYRTRQFSPGIF